MRARRRALTARGGATGGRAGATAGRRAADTGRRAAGTAVRRRALTSGLPGTGAAGHRGAALPGRLRRQRPARGGTGAGWRARGPLAALLEILV